MNQPDSALSPYRALDLTDQKGFLCGKILGELGADVIKVEPPGGDPGRRHGPFYENKPDSRERDLRPERSLYWWAFNTSKRGITLDITGREGRNTFKKLVETTDFVIESFAPGYLDNLGLGYAALQRINPGVILASITPFGQTGPHRDFKATDLTLMAMGGQMSVSGDSDRPPVRISAPQAFMHGGGNAAAACLIALHYRERTGLGQHIDLSIHEAVARSLGSELSYWYYSDLVCHRYGPCRPRGTILIRDVWECRDGYVTLKVLGGPRLREIRPLIEWMVREGKAGALANTDWNNLGTFTKFNREVEEFNDIVAAFFKEHTVAEIMALTLSAQLPIMPDNAVGDVTRNEQLAARNFWVKVEQPEIGRAVVYPGAPYILSETPWKMRCPAPRIGQHNEEVLSGLQDASRPNRLNELSRPNRLNEVKELPARALEGIKVADFTWVLTGPLTIKYLANFGAEVIKVESGTRLDNSRITIPYKDGIEGVNRAGPFQLFNAGKKSLSLNLSHPKGRELARKVAAWADVVAENFTPGTMAKWGLGYEDLKKIKPDIIMLSASIQGGTGPYKQHPGFGWNLSGVAGFNHLTGWPDRGPVSPHTAYTDWVAPVYGAIAILAALDYRRRTGKGQHIDLSQFEAGVSYLAAAILDYTVNGNS
ncbi:MAG: CoA transferase, partial [Chloroflexi bacterium]|nr:CoA transferase [Chloroflexota bacterium]